MKDVGDMIFIRKKEHGILTGEENIKRLWKNYLIQLLHIENETRCIRSGTLCKRTNCGNKQKGKL